MSDEFKVGDTIELTEAYSLFKKGSVHKIVDIRPSHGDIDGSLYYVAHRDPNIETIGMYAKRFQRASQPFAVGDHAVMLEGYGRLAPGTEVEVTDAGNDFGNPWVAVKRLSDGHVESCMWAYRCRRIDPPRAFKVGDTIELTEDYYGLKKGSIHTILYKESTGDYDIDGPLYYVAHRDPNIETIGMYARRFQRAPREFKVGDKVRVVKARPGGRDNFIVGAAGEVVEAKPHHGPMNVGEHMVYTCRGGSALPFPADCLEHVEAPAVDPRDARIAELEAESARVRKERNIAFDEIDTLRRAIADAKDRLAHANDLANRARYDRSLSDMRAQRAEARVAELESRLAKVREVAK